MAEGQCLGGYSNLFECEHMLAGWDSDNAE